MYRISRYVPLLLGGVLLVGCTREPAPTEQATPTAAPTVAEDPDNLVTLKVPGMS